MAVYDGGFYSGYSRTKSRNQKPKDLEEVHSVQQKLPDDDAACVGLRVFAVRSNDGLPVGVICNVVEVFKTPDGTKRVRVDRRGSVVPKDDLRIA